MSQPLVSVVTPFHNTADCLAECIESVLSQSYPNFEYILVDNCSSDGSGAIAEKYASRDPRIRLLRRTQLLSQVQNYNAALAEISSESQYCKMVQADDFLFPDCLRLMVRAAEQSASVGLISAYDLKANIVRGSGFPYGTAPVSGKEVGRFFLRTGIFIFGSPTTVMYRSAIVRKSPPFYDERLLHEDTEKCMQILQQWDFAFVPQVLSFLRVDQKSITGKSQSFKPDALDNYIIVQRYASAFLDEREASVIKSRCRKAYYQVVAEQALRLPVPSFWRYHQAGLETLGQKLDSSYLALRIVGILLWFVLNPGLTLRRAVSYLKR